MDAFSDVKQAALPEASADNSLSKNSEQVFSGGIRILLDGGGFILIGNCGKNDAGQTRWGIVINDGQTNRKFDGIDPGGF